MADVPKMMFMRGSPSSQGRAHSEFFTRTGSVPLVSRILNTEFLYHFGLASVGNVRPLTDSRKLDKQSMLPKKALRALTNHPFFEPPHGASQARLMTATAPNQPSSCLELKSSLVHIDMIVGMYAWVYNIGVRDLWGWPTSE